MGYSPPQLQVRRVAGGDACYGNGVTTDDLTIFANTTDAYPSIILEGAGDISIVGDGTGSKKINFKDRATTILKLYPNGYCCFENPVNNSDIYLKTTGSGVLRFGTFTASGDVACNGSIAIKDASGSAIKLMTTA